MNDKMLDNEELIADEEELINSICFTAFCPVCNKSLHRQKRDKK